MNQLNNIIFEGTAINNAELVERTIDTNESVVKFTLANDRYYLDRTKTPQSEVTFMVIRCIGDFADKMLEVIKRGLIYKVAGRITTLRWKTKTGESRMTYEIDAAYIEVKENKHYIDARKLAEGDKE